MNYKLINHTADLGIHVFGPDLEKLFANGAYAMFQLITPTEKLEGKDNLTIKASGYDWPDLMVNWLRELLYLFNGEKKLVKSISIISLAKYDICANLKLDSFVHNRHLINNDIKAVTYHQIFVEKESKGWKAGIIFDV